MPGVTPSLRGHAWIRCQNRGISSRGLAVQWASGGKACCMHTLRHEACIGARQFRYQLLHFGFSLVIYLYIVSIVYNIGELYSVLCGDLNGKEIQKRGDIYIYVCIWIADSICCRVETSKTLQSNYTPIKINFKSISLWKLVKEKVKRRRHSEWQLEMRDRRGTKALPSPRAVRQNHKQRVLLEAAAAPNRRWVSRESRDGCSQITCTCVSRKQCLQQN